MKLTGGIADLDRIEMRSPDVKNAFMKVLVGPEQGWEDHVMRVIELENFGFSPKHAHPWPHINYIIEGEGMLEMDGEHRQVKAGDFAFVPSGTLHQFRSNSENTFRFICIVPKDGHQ